VKIQGSFRFRIFHLWGIFLSPRNFDLIFSILVTLCPYQFQPIVVNILAFIQLKLSSLTFDPSEPDPPFQKGLSKNLNK